VWFEAKKRVKGQLMATVAFDVANALKLGRFLQAAYDLFSSGDPPGFIPPDGYTLVHKVYADDITDGLPLYKVFGFIARSAGPGSDVIVAIRGTEGLLEWIMDFQFLQTPFPYLAASGLTEQGFTGFYSTFRIGPDDTQPRVIEAIRTLLAGGGVASLSISGHSLGSALATLLASDVAGNGVCQTPSVYTFASPRVGDKVFAGTYDNLVPVSWRIANLNDIVTQLPPLLAGYVHVDTEFPINSDDSTKHGIRCWHGLATYLHTLDPGQPLDPSCVPV
jgi:predicted lipase